MVLRRIDLMDLEENAINAEHNTEDQSVKKKKEFCCLMLLTKNAMLVVKQKHLALIM